MTWGAMAERLISGALIGALVGGWSGHRAHTGERARWRTYTCAQHGAQLVADTLCVRADSTWRVAEPPEGGR